MSLSLWGPQALSEAKLSTIYPIAKVNILLSLALLQGGQGGGGGHGPLTFVLF